MKTHTEVECNVTEYDVIPESLNTVNVFVINQKSMIINFCNDKGTVLRQSEIDINDAITLARIILKVKS